MIEHTAKYNDAYSTIDKFVDGFWERVPYLCIGLTVIIIFWLLSKLFKFFVRKTLENKSYTRQNLVLVLNRVGSTAIMFFGFLIAMVIAIPGFTPAQLMSALGIGSVAIGFAFTGWHATNDNSKPIPATHAMNMIKLSSKPRFGGWLVLGCPWSAVRLVLLSLVISYVLHVKGYFCYACR